MYKYYRLIFYIYNVYNNTTEIHLSYIIMRDDTNILRVDFNRIISGKNTAKNKYKWVKLDKDQWYNELITYVHSIFILMI